MKLYPLYECAADLDDKLRSALGVQITFYQQFQCAGCGTKQTMDDPNVLYTSGKCEECGHITDIKKDGCNYMLHIQAKHQGTDAE